MPNGIFTLVFALVSAFSTNNYWLWISIFYVGFGVATVDLSYVVIVEFFPSKYRTMFPESSKIFWTLRISTFGCRFNRTFGDRSSLGSRYHSFSDWFLLISIAFLPNTPDYCLAAGNEQKALNILQVLAPETWFRVTKGRFYAAIFERYKFGNYETSVFMTPHTSFLKHTFRQDSSLFYISQK